MAKVLVVDDSGMSRRALRKILEPAGYTVVEAEDGIAALEKYFLDKPDLVLLDLTMKGMYGIDVLTRLREMDRDACVIVATADIQRSTREMVTDAGARAMINKPFIYEEVLSTVKAALTGGEDAADRKTE